MHQQEEIKGKSNKAIIRIVLLLLVVALIGGVYAFLWNTNFKWHEETEDAYVNSHQNVVTSQLSGNIVKVFVDDTQYVKKGQLIAQIDNTDYLLALDNARVELEQAIRKYYSLTNNVSVSSNTLTAKKIDFLKNESDYKRESLLFKKGLISQESYDVIKNNYNQSKLQYTIAQDNYKNDKIQSASEDIKNHPDVAKSIINYQKAAINLARTDIYATFNGTIAKRSVYLGQKINENQNLFTIVDLNNSWVDANLKENQLKNLKVGQSVEIISDVNKQAYEGVVKGVAAGSGSAFSLLPAQNATGNWIKVVQRVPVRIEILPESLKEHGVLPVGSSVVVDINTHTDQSLKSVKIAITESTEIFKANYSMIDLNVDEIVKETLLKMNK
jgi:membrane fusion protein (multidrug efflux system)